MKIVLDRQEIIDIIEAEIVSQYSNVLGLNNKGIRLLWPSYKIDYSDYIFEGVVDVDEKELKEKVE